MLDKTIEQKYSKWVQNGGSWELAEIFHRNRSKFEYPDIYRYGTEDLLREIKEKDIRSKRNEKQEGSEHVYNCSQRVEYQVIRIDSYAACKKYFSGTKLCITGVDFYLDYILNQGSKFYLLIAKTDEKARKFALKVKLRERKKKLGSRMWDEKDHAHSVEHLPNEVLNRINKDIQAQRRDKQYFSLLGRKNNKLFLEFIKEFPDIEKKEKYDRCSNALHQIMNNHVELALKETKYFETHNISLDALIKNIKIKECQFYMLKRCSISVIIKNINKLNYKDPYIRAALLAKAKSNTQLKSKCQEIGILSKPKTRQNSEVAELRKEIKELRKIIEKGIKK